MLREPFGAPQQEAYFHQKRNKILFKHPAYQDQLGDNDLFSLWAWDSPSGGLCHETALLACAIIACNATDGFLSKDRTGLERLDLKDNPILSPAAYYFHVTSPDPVHDTQPQPQPQPYAYPVCVGFDHWRYPHDADSFPAWMQPWATTADPEPQEQLMGTPSVSNVSAAVVARDRTCILTGEGDSLDRAHICPRSAQEWFHKNRMQRYNDRQDLSGDLITDDLANALAMSCSRHRAFDAGLFVFVPKRGTWVAHFMEVTAHYGSQHHNKPVKLPQNVAPQEAINKILQAGRGRSASPRKRSAPDPDPELEQRDAVYADLRHRKRPCNTADSIGSDAYVTQQPDTPQSPAIDSVHSTRVAKLQAPPPHHDLLCRQTYLSDASFDGRQSNTSAEEVHEQRRISDLRAAALRNSRPTNRELICCDYDAAEKANAMDIYGKEEFGGGHLCMECLGMEIRHDES
ncbi:hypothetical protein D6C78_06241 [Aureobasidium pullulans]|uniref:HNH nuclease domain-containing protein n=1 Tax=Aureobasidium pullulans TaxID=5580 RepID=A0A4T0BL83_AURPU|nr:hypothetical protein D6C78_06241 [Aureobasidium pullulans]